MTGRPDAADGFSADESLLELASTRAWVENFLNFTNGYYKVTSSEGDQFEYLVPFPPGYTISTKAYWTTDVIALEPSCNWQTATKTGPVNTNGYSTWTMTIPQSNLSILWLNSTFCMFLFSSKVFMCLVDFSIKRPLRWGIGFS